MESGNLYRPFGTTGRRIRRFSTSLGTLVLTGAQNVSFGATVAAVPEPATISLIAISLFGALALGRFRRR
jgi:hypothetical protein